LAEEEVGVHVQGRHVSATVVGAAQTGVPAVVPAPERTDLASTGDLQIDRGVETLLRDSHFDATGATVEAERAAVEVFEVFDIGQVQDDLTGRHVETRVDVGGRGRSCPD